MEDHFFQCLPKFRDGEEISMLVDYSHKHQNYIEDCEVCCHPIQLIIGIDNNEIVSFKAEIAQ
ncbi:MAG TPA: CPXCG motif-containing cysteine-rich protein [Flavobacteriaceae bacterium]